jgi:hypothetical protein
MERREVEENGTAIAYFLPETLHITGDVADASVASWHLRCGSFSRAGYGWQASLRRPILGRSRSI